MKLKLSILLTILSLISTVAFGQKDAVKPVTETKVAAAKMPSVKKILKKYVKAIGGKKANEKIKSRVGKGTLDLSPMGVKGTVEIYSAAPNKSLNKTTLAGIGDIIEGFDGTTAWTINPLQGNRDKQGEELAQTKLTSDFYREINLDKVYPKMELKGVEKVGANDAYVVVGTPASGQPETFYFDVKSGLLVREDAIAVTPEGKTPTKTFFEDVREVDGVKMPFKIRTVLPQFEITVNITEIKQNVPIEDSKFAKPKE